MYSLSSTVVWYVSNNIDDRVSKGCFRIFILFEILRVWTRLSNSIRQGCIGLTPNRVSVNVFQNLYRQFSTSTESSRFWTEVGQRFVYNVYVAQSYLSEIGSVHCGKFADMRPFPPNLSFGVSREPSVSRARNRYEFCLLYTSRCV